MGIAISVARMHPSRGLDKISISPDHLRCVVRHCCVSLEQISESSSIQSLVAHLLVSQTQSSLREFPWPNASGLHPAFEKDQRLVATADCSTEFDCVRAMHESLKSTNLDVDAHLDQSQLAMAKAVTMMIEQDLEPATLYTAWCENEGFKQYKV